MSGDKFFLRIDKFLNLFRVIHIYIIVGFIVFSNALFNNFVWDDVQILNDSNVHSLTGIQQMLFNHVPSLFYRPAASVIQAGIYIVFGPTPFWYHFSQLILHIIISILLFAVFRRFVRKIIAFSMALVFLVHPMNVESVSYISALQTVLSLFFGLIALFIVDRKIAAIYKYSLVFLFVLLSLFSKETGILFIVYIPLFIIFTIKNKFTKKELIFSCISLTSAALVYLLARWPLQFGSSILPIPIMHAPFYQRMLTVPKIFFYYLLTFLYPKELAVSQMWVVKVISFQDFIFPLIVDILFLLGVSAGIYRLYRNKNKNFKAYLFFLVWFLLAMGMNLQIIPLDMTVADRWFYVAMVGLLGLIGIMINEIIVKNIKIKLLASVLALCIIILFSGRTMLRNTNWNNQLTLFSHDEVISYESYDLESQITNAYLASGQLDAAKIHIDKELQLAPNYYGAWNNLGVYYEGKKQYDKSIRAFSKAIQLNRDYTLGYFNLAKIYYQYKSPKETKSYLDSISGKFNDNPYYLYLRAIVDYKLGAKQDAIDEITQSYNLSKDQIILNTAYQMQEGNTVNLAE